MRALARSRVGIHTHLALPGPLADERSVAEVRAQLRTTREEGEVRIVLDFSRVTLVDGAALEMLLEAQDALARAGGGLKLVNVKGTVCDVMRITEVVDSIAVLDQDGSVVSRARPPLRGAGRQKLGELLVARGLVSADRVSRAVELQSRTQRRLGQILVENGWLAEADLLGLLSEQFGLPYTRLRRGVFDPAAVRLVGADLARSLGVVPLFKVRNTVYLAASDAQSIPSFDTVAEVTGFKVKPVLALAAEIQTTIDDASGDDHNLTEYISELDSVSDVEVIDEQLSEDNAVIDRIAAGSPVVNLINGLIQRAVRDGASDIHIEPSRQRCRVRFRIDGVLYEVMRPPAEVHPALVSRLKVLANLDIAERRLPQDGRIQVYTHGRTVDLRFSSMPGVYGEKVVLRVLDKSQGVMDIEKLGMSTDNLEKFKHLLHRTHGLLLVTGPTGSGKTTTLYAGLSHLNSIEKSIVTIEDPVEYQMDIINQNQVREAVGLTFARILKHVLRQDPDIVMVGEIRERETAEIAVRAALTGHLVLSTLHTNDSVGAVTRLLDMGIEPFLLSSALIGVMAQRLVRSVCPECRTTYVPLPGSLERYGVTDPEGIQLVRGRGCSSCYDSGYKGRIAIHELMDCTPDTQRLIVSSAGRDVLAEHMAERGVRTLLDEGITQALQRRTTVEEVTRVVAG